MRTLLAAIFILSALVTEATGQDDPAARKLLDKFSDRALSAPSVSMKFDLVTMNQAENTSDTLNGSVILNKDKYKLDLPDNVVWFNGETAWSYLPAEKEVTITNADRKDNSFQNRPSAIFTAYKKDYKCRLIEENSGACTIDLYPKDIKSDLVRIRLILGKPGMDLRSLEYKRRDGISVIIRVKEYDLQYQPAQDLFVFQPSAHKGVEIIDMR